MSLSTTITSCRLAHHGSAASSASHTLVWLPTDTDRSSSSSSQIVYASHGILNVCERRHVRLLPAADPSCSECVWTVIQTLRTDTTSDGGDPAKRVVTSLASLSSDDDNHERTVVALACGFSDGTVTLWWRPTMENETTRNDSWKEQPLTIPKQQQDAVTSVHAITDLAGRVVTLRNGKTRKVMLVTCSSEGVYLLMTTNNNNNNGQEKNHGDETFVQKLASFASNTVQVHSLSPFGTWWILVGTAAPRHNKIHVYSMDKYKEDHTTIQPHYCGSLTGHEDWITCLAWKDQSPFSSILASGSQDAKIRLWQFTTVEDAVTMTDIRISDDDHVIEVDGNDDDDDDEILSDDEQGESRMEIIHEGRGITRVTLEALLLGHEEAVTSVHWHPNPQALYGHSSILVSSSMDQTLLIWSPTSGGGVWTPLTRVGSAGGILGGSIGSTLLGFVHAAVEPMTGQTLVGHAYGGALHFWSLDSGNSSSIQDKEEGEPLSLDELALRNQWKATPCLTGHFAGVSDLCWEAESGEYLLTVSMDQTCRLWAPLGSNNDDVWVELARPQVHGYDLSAVTSISTPNHRHLFVSGADEKELRVFDAPMTTIRLLRAIQGVKDTDVDMERVERAFIPSLGLSNKASAAEGAEEDTVDNDVLTHDQPQVRLPLENDLGAVSLWPEIRKLFGHNTEIFCLDSTVAARTGPSFASSPFAKDVLVASSAKARDANDASIRIWDVEQGKCVQVLGGGHRSTIAALSFSSDGTYLASSGKDRRLCIWRRTPAKEGCEPQSPLFALVAAVDSAHKRIVWGVHFCPHDPLLLASGSRDGCVKIWKLDESLGHDVDCNVSIQEIHSFEPSSRVGRKAESVTALAFAPQSPSTSSGDITAMGILALGLECGFIELWAIPTTANLDSVTCQLLYRFPRSLCHMAAVRKLGWRPLRGMQSDETDDILHSAMTLASCGMDHGCRIFDISFR